MPTYSIATDRSSLSIGFKPAFPGLAATAAGLRGEFEVAIDEHATIDWEQPATGRFELRVDELSLGNRLMTMGARRWLEPDRFDRITGELLDVRPKGDNRFQSRVRIAIKDMDVALAATGRFAIEGIDCITVYGRTFSDPRQFGVYLPPFLNFMVHVRWNITLEPTPPTPSTTGAEFSTKT